MVVLVLTVDQKKISRKRVIFFAYKKTLHVFFTNIIWLCLEKDNFCCKTEWNLSTAVILTLLIKFHGSYFYSVGTAFESRLERLFWRRCFFMFIHIGHISEHKKIVKYPGNDSTHPSVVQILLLPVICIVVSSLIFCLYRFCIVVLLNYFDSSHFEW
jgi:hypothetical protein